MADRKLVVQLVGDERDLLRAYGRAGKATEGFGRSVSRSLGNIAKAGVFAGVTAGVVGLTAALKVGVGEFAEAQQVTAKTNAILKATGGVANVTAKQVDTLANSLMNKTGIDDEQIKTGENLLLTFKQIRNEVGAGNDVFDRATRATLDLSQAGFGSLDSAAKMLGKALNDPVRGLTALGRAGVTFTAAQKQQIKALAESGRVLEAQKVILAEVESQVGGTAAAVGRTLPGRLNVLRQSLANLAGEVVGDLAPALTRQIGLATRWVQNAENQRRVTEFVRDAVSKLKAIVEALIPILRTAAAAVQKLSDVLGGAKNTLITLGATIAALKLASLASSFGLIRAQAAAASTQVGVLRGRLLALSAIGAIPVIIDLAIQQRERDTAEAEEGTRRIYEEFARRFAIHDLDDLEAIRSTRRLTSRPAIPARVSGQAQTQTRDSGVRLGMVSGSTFVKGFREGLIPELVKGQSFAQDAIAKLRTLVPNQVGGTSRVSGGLLQSAQFRALGLTSTGDALAPTRRALRTEAQKLGDALKGTMLDTAGTRNLMQRIRKVLSGQLGGLSRDVRLKVQELLGDLRQQLGDQPGPMTPWRAPSTKQLTEGLGLTRQQRAAFRQRIAGSGIVTGAPVAAAAMPAAATNIGGVTINVYEARNAKATADLVVKELKRTARRGAAPTRGRHGGQVLGLN